MRAAIPPERLKPRPAVATLLTVTLYTCASCGRETPSPGRLEGNWCPHCGKIDTLVFSPGGEAAEISSALGGKRERSSGGMMQAVERVHAAARGDDRAALNLLLDPKRISVIFLLDEEGGPVALIDIFRACGFRMKTLAYRAVLELAKAGLVERVGEEEEWALTENGARLLKKIRDEGM